MKKTISFKADGMTCNSCEKIIKKTALSFKGVYDCDVNYATQTGEITFNPAKIDINKVLNEINKKGYNCSIRKKSKSLNYNNVAGLFFWTIGLLVLGYFLLSIIDRVELPEISQNMGYGLIILTGLLTGFHCISMCGGFVVSYSAKNPNKTSHLVYGLGKTLSYTIIGAGFGLLGSVITFTPLMRGVAGVIAGVFLLLYGLQMLNIFPILRKIRITTPSFITRFVGEESSKHSNPLILGLLNGLMLACGPLQAMYVMAAGTGSIIEGAKTLFFFGLGTLPVMLGFGFVTSFISSKHTYKIMKASGAIVIIMGLLMVNNGLALTGTGYDLNSIITTFGLNSATGAVIAEPSLSINADYQEIRMNVMRNGWEPNRFVLKTGVPVKWVINGLEINGCNNAIQVPALGLEFDIKKGEQIIEFTPAEEGVISWSCWMGMIPGVFIVTDDVESASTESVVLPDSTGRCGGGCGGGCGCGCGR